MVDAFRDHENLTTRTYAMCDPTQVEFCIREDDVRTLLRDVEARNLDHLAKLCRLNQKFMEFENALAGKKFVHCSNVFCEMQEAVGALIGTAVEEPVLMNCRIQLLQWRQLFASRLEAHFNSTCYFHHKSHTATSTQSQTAELWSAFEVLNSIEDKARDLAAHTNTYILTPLAHTIRHLSRHHLDVEAFSLSWNTTVWTFTERAGDPPSPTESFLFILESFLNHVKEQWGQTPMQHYGPAVWEHAVTHLESFLGDANAGGAPPLVADAQRENHIDLCLAFELQLQGEHIITNLPLHHIVEQRRSGIEDREQILGEARQWMLVQDMCTMRVSHETEETALRVLDSELSSLFLPWCSISVNTKKLMDAVREQICTADPSKAEENQRLVWRLLNLFVLVRPHVNRAKFIVDPVLSGIFYNDCQYLVFHLAALPYDCKGSPQSLCAHFVPLLRSLAESHFSAMLEHQEKLLLDPLGAVEDQEDMVLVETRIKEIIQLLRTTFSCLEVLPAKLMAETKEVLCAKVMERMLKSLRAPELQMKPALYLLSSMQSQLHQLVEPPWVLEKPKRVGEQFATALTILGSPGSDETKHKKLMHLMH
eukprot:GEMP01020136.1.p1 GENE.GEMP01020136.1~~GEMP01020136.1.p1  ORF type:complete len:594 (+),score=104.98 GEMP01020136.1:80-1861(+)